jgi:hypothetical protein
MSNPDVPVRSLRRRPSERGATMVSVMMLTVSLMTVGLLAVRSSGREVVEAGQLVARERALVAAQSALDLAAGQYLGYDEAQLDAALMGNLPQTACVDACGDCLPGNGVGGSGLIVTGQRNELLASAAVDCGGRPCMRQGAVSRLRDASNSQSNWCDVPMRDLLEVGDAEARVSVWVRNNAGDALGTNGSGSWTDDGDSRIVLTAQATVRGSTVAIEQEVLLNLGPGVSDLMPQTADEGYGGGHNNDNSAVSVCSDQYQVATPAP